MLMQGGTPELRFLVQSILASTHYPRPHLAHTNGSDGVFMRNPKGEFWRSHLRKQRGRCRSCWQLSACEKP